MAGSGFQVAGAPEWDDVAFSADGLQLLLRDRWSNIQVILVDADKALSHAKKRLAIDVE